MSSGGQKHNGSASSPGSADLDTQYPTNPAVAPLPPDPEFAGEISEDLLEDAAQGLKLLHPIKPQPTPEKGISLEEIGVEMQIQTKHTTQKIYIEELPRVAPDQDETVIDLDKMGLDLARAERALADAAAAAAAASTASPSEDDDDNDTQSMDRREVEAAARRLRRGSPDFPTLRDEDETGDI